MSLTTQLLDAVLGGCAGFIIAQITMALARRIIRSYYAARELRRRDGVRRDGFRWFGRR